MDVYPDSMHFTTFVCQFEVSVNTIIPFSRGDHKQKFYWGHKEILIPVYKKMSDAMNKHPNADVLVTFASLRSAYESTLEALEYSQVCINIRCVRKNFYKKLR